MAFLRLAGAWFLWTALTLSSAKALTPAKATLADFCANPYESICGEQNEAEIQRESRILEIKEAIAKASRTEMAAKVPEVVPAVGGDLETFDLKALFSERNTASISKELRERVLEAYFKSLTDELKMRLGNSFETAQKNFEAVRSLLLKQSLERTEKALKSLSNKDRETLMKEMEDMREHLLKARLVNVTDIFDGNEDDEDFIQDVIEECGSDGLADNAFAFRHVNKVVICPGDFVAQLGLGAGTKSSGSLAFAGSIWTLGHEIGHLVDYTDHKLAYEKMKWCVEEHYAETLDHPGQLEDYMGEISGDYWGSEALADYLPKLNTAQEKLRAIQESLEGICGGEGVEDDGIHPSGRFRIENFVRRNPRIHKAVGCPLPLANKETGPTCTMGGNWDYRKEGALRFW